MADRTAAKGAPIDTWVFDLDNTLYDPQARLFDQIEARMRAFISRELGLSLSEADALRARYWAEYGTTLAGLMAQHGVAPLRFLDDVHDIDLSGLAPDPKLKEAIVALPGRRIVFTNGDAPYATRVLERLRLTGAFDALYGIEHAGFVPKPEAEAFDAIIAQDGFHPGRAAMFEDTARNLEVPHQRGMATILVHGDAEPADHIHHHTKDLAVFLSHVDGAALPPRGSRIPL